MASPSSSTTIDRGYNVLYITLGCAKNEVDTDRMRARLLASGFGEVADPESADVCNYQHLLVLGFSNRGVY